MGKSQFKNFKELKEACYDMLKSTKKRGSYSGLKKLLTQLYPKKAHFIYELLQNAEDKSAENVIFELHRDKLVFKHDGKKRDFNLDDIDSITNIGNSTKTDDPTSIGQFGIGFKAVYAYTSTPEIHSGSQNFKIIDMLVPEDEGVPKISKKGETVFIFPFDSPEKDPENAYSEIKSGLSALDENSILFLNHIKNINFSIVNSGITGSVTIEQIKEVNSNLFKITKRFEWDTKTTYWLKFTDDAIKDISLDDVDQNIKELPISVAYNCKIENGNIVFNDQLVGQSFIFFPTSIKTGYHFHVNAPFASTVARDNIKDCNENSQLIYSLAELIVKSFDLICRDKIMDQKFYSLLPNSHNYPNINDKTNKFNAFYHAIHEAFIQRKYCKNVDGEYCLLETVLMTNKYIRNLINNKQAKELFNRSWLLPLTPQSNEFYFFKDLYDESKLSPFDETMFLKEIIKHDKISTLCVNKKDTDWFRLLYIILNDGLTKSYMTQADKADVINKLRQKQILFLSNDTVSKFDTNIYIQTEYEPQNPKLIKQAKYISPFITDGETSGYRTIVDFLHSLGIVEMTKLIDVSSIESQNDLLESALKDFESNNSIDAYKETAIFKTRSLSNNEPNDELAKAKECCSKDYALFYDKADEFHYFENRHSVAYCLDEEFYSKNYSKNKFDKIKDLFIELGGVNHFIPIIKSCNQSPENPNWNFDMVEGREISTGRNQGIDQDCTLIGIEALDYFEKLNSIKEAKLLWNDIIDTTHSSNINNLLVAKYMSNKYAHKVHEFDTYFIWKLKNTKWIPAKDGKFYTPTDMTREMLLPDFNFDENNKILKAICFANKMESIAEKTKKLVNVSELLKSGVPQSAIKLISSLLTKTLTGNITEDDLSKMLSTLNKPVDTLKNIDPKIFDPNRPQKPIKLQDLDEITQKKLKRIDNIDKRKKKIQERFEESQKENINLKHLKLTYQSSSKKDEKEYVSHEYGGECQICGARPIIKHDGDIHFEAINIIRTSNLPDDILNSIKIGWNTLCLCPTCAAKFKHSALIYSPSFIEQVINANINDFPENPYIDIILMNEKQRITFTPSHFQRLQTILEKIIKLSNTK